MIATHLSDDSCLDYLTGDVSIEERASIGIHLERCPHCLLRLEQYRELFRAGLPSIAAETGSEIEVLPLPWSIEEGENRLVEAARADAQNDLRATRELYPKELLSLESLEKPHVGRRLFLPRNGPLGLAIAASVVLLIGFSGFVYRLGVKHGAEQIQASRAGAAEEEALHTQVDILTRERNGLRADSLQRDTVVVELRSQIEQQRKLNQLAEAKLASLNQEGTEQVRQLSSQRDELASKLEEQQALLTAMQKNLDSIQQAKSNEALRVASLENQIQQLAGLVKDKDIAIEEREQLLALDRDIRELMGARNLYMAEVSEVGENGKTKRPYGRVFLTKGKSLIFYGYDLDQQPGVKNASTFQAWGMRGPDHTALNLGPMIKYDDNSKNKHWMLRFDDPKALEQINAVFVTVEPNGESRVPRGKPMLVAYLKEEANHP
jgi:hypothetical protein